MDEPISKFSTGRYQGGRLTATQDRVAVEEPWGICLRGEPFQVLMRLPGWEKELAPGFFYTGGIVRDLDEVITIRFCGAATNPLLPPNVVDVQLADAAWERRGRRHPGVAYAGCGLCAKEALDEICRATAPVSWAWLAGAAGSANKTRMAAVIAFAINSFPLEVLKSP